MPPSPLFPGENDIEQLCCVLRILGTPSCQVWPEITELPDCNKISFKEQAPAPLEEVLPNASPQALDLPGWLLLYPPQQRVSASQALLHHCFFTAPLLSTPRSCRSPRVQGALPPSPTQDRPPPTHPHTPPSPVHDFHVDQPLDESLLNPDLIRPFILEG